MSFPDQSESFLTVAEVASLLKLNQQTVRNWIDQKTLPAVRVGRRVRIKRSDLQRFVDQGYLGTPAEMPPPRGPSAEDFWGGEPVGVAELDQGGGGGSDPSEPSAQEDDARRQEEE